MMQAYEWGVSVSEGVPDWVKCVWHSDCHVCLCCLSMLCRLVLPCCPYVCRWVRRLGSLCIWLWWVRSGCWVHPHAWCIKLNLSGVWCQSSLIIIVMFTRSTYDSTLFTADSPVSWMAINRSCLIDCWSKTWQLFDYSLFEYWIAIMTRIRSLEAADITHSCQIWGRERWLEDVGISFDYFFSGLLHRYLNTFSHNLFLCVIVRDNLYILTL